MRRSIIKQGNNSYTLTLPIDWIREEKLLEGGNVEIVQEENRLIVSVPADVKKSESKIELDLDSYSTRTVSNLLKTMYRMGFDSMILKFQEPKMLDSIKEVVRKTLLGFEVTSEDKNSCTVQNIAEPSADKFDVMLRKVFLFISDDSKAISQSFKTGKLNAKRFDDSIALQDDYTNFCRRVIIKNKIGGSKNSYSYYLLVGRLSLIYHSYYYMHKFAAAKKLKLGKETLEVLDKTNKLFDDFYNVFYKHNLEKVNEIEIERDKLVNSDIYSLLQKKKGAENVILYHIGEILRLIHFSSLSFLK